nr:putative transposase [Ipomoea batatas]
MLELHSRTFVRELDGANFSTFTYPLMESEGTSMSSDQDKALQELGNALMHIVSIKDIYEKENANARLKLLDKDCIQLVGMAIVDLRAKNRRVTPQLLKQIQSLVGLGKLFMVEVKREHLENRYSPFS